VVPRARHALAAASVAIVLRVVVACSTSGAPAPAAPYDATPGEAFTACQIQGYVSEAEGGACPEGTCPVLAFDTNGARVPCCTSIVSGPGMCFDDAATNDAAMSAPDGSEAGESGPDATIDGATDGATDGAVEADAESGVSEASPPPDGAADDGD
jgi:hypothetical protein